VIFLLANDLRVDTFFNCSGALPWFLHEGRFREAVALSIGKIVHLVPALVSAVYLWAIKLYPTDELSGHAPSLLSQSLCHIGQALKDGPSHSIVQVIQAHVLLAEYLYAAGRLLEGRQQTAAAASLAITCGLHRVRSSRTSAHYAAFVDTMEVILPEPHDSIEEGERIDAFWTTFCQDRIWAVVMGVPVSIACSDTDGTRIDTPWSMDISVCDTVSNLIFTRIYDMSNRSSSVRYCTGTSLSHPSHGRYREDLNWHRNEYLLTGHLYAYALQQSVLPFLASNCLGENWDTRQVMLQLLSRLLLHVISRSTYHQEAAADCPEILDICIEELRKHMFPVSGFKQLSPASLQRTHFVHCLIHSATIQLHSAFVRQNAISRTKCLEAAFQVLWAGEAAKVHEFAFLNTAIGVCKLTFQVTITH
jgi:hypothetical protein